MGATIRDVAGSAGVSETAVSLAFRPGSRISEPTRRRILISARRLKYVPNQAARNLRHGNSRMLGVLVTDITNPFWARMAREVEITAETLGYTVIIAESQWDAEREVAHIDRMIQDRVRGVVVCFCEKSDEAALLLRKHGMPHVALDTVPSSYRGAYVCNDLASAGRLAAEHFVETGRRRPVLFLPRRTAEHRFSSLIRLKAGFGRALRAAGIPFGEKQVFDSGWTIPDGLATFSEVRLKVPDVDGVLCSNDLCALGVIEAADRAGLRVGQDLGVIGIDNLPVSDVSRVSLTSIRQPDAALAELATRELIAAIEEDRAVTIRKKLKPELIVRNSTRKTRAGSVGVREAQSA